MPDQPQGNPQGNPGVNPQGVDGRGTERIIVGNGYNLNEKDKLSGTENYRSWEFLMKGLLYNEGLLEVIEGTEQSPDKLKRAYYRIAANVTTQVHPLLYNVTDGLTAWTSLRTNFGAVSNSSKLELYQTLFSIRMDNYKSMSEYVNVVMTTQEKLVQLKKGLDDEIVAYLILIGLPAQYEPVKMAISSLNQNLTSDFVRERLLNCAVNSNSSDSAFFAARHLKVQNYQHEKKAPVICHYCKKPGHIQKDCRARLKALQQKKNAPPPPKAEKANHVFDPTPHVADPPEPRVLMCVETANPTLKAHIPDYAFAARSNRLVAFIDSGATRHMCNDRRFFKDFEDISLDILVANDARVPCIGKGSITLNCADGPVTITDVLYVPDLSANLVSVSVLTSKGFGVMFDDRECVIMKNKQVWLTAKRKDNLYVLSETEEAFVAAADQTLWHKRMGHLSTGQMKKLKKQVSGMDEVTIKSDTCEICLEGKLSRKAFQQSLKRGKGLLDLIHSDLMGPASVPSFGGGLYAMTFIDDHSRKIYVYILSNKSQALSKFKEFKAMVETQTERRIKVLRTDNGREYVNHEFDGFLKEHGIIHHLTCIHTPQQNGRAERPNRTLIEMARCMLLDSGLDKRFWAECINCAVYVRNRSPSSPLTNAIPEEVWSGEPVDIGHLRTFGSMAYVLIPKQKRGNGKLDPVSEKMIFVGYSDVTKGYRFVLPNNPGTVVRSRDATFLEMEKHKSSKNNLPEESNLFPIACIESLPPPPLVEEEIFEEEFFEAEDYESNQEDDLEEELVEFGPENRKYPERQRQPKVEKDMVYNFSVVTDDPQTVAEATSRPDSQEWIKAMETEMESLRKNGTWELTDRPTDRKTITTKWVFKLKKDASGVPVKYKARLVARGFDQRYGVDYAETFSPTIDYSNVRLLLALAAKLKWHVHHVDVTAAFLNGKLDEAVYIEQPEGFKVGSSVCRLIKAIYGLKQASRAWHSTLTEVLLAAGFQRSNSEACILFKGTGDDLVVIAVYVDDILVLSKLLAAISLVKDLLSKKFELWDFGTVRSYLGVRVVFDMSAGSVSLDQTAYIQETLEKFNMADCNPASTPLCTSQHLLKPVNPLPVGEKPYQQLLGRLMYIGVFTRPDIMHSLSVLSQFSKGYSQEHWIALKRVLRYLKGSASLKLTYSKNGEDFTMWCDSDWGNCKIDRRSYTGYLSLLAGGAVSWESRKQRIVALSSTQAELVALTEACKEGIHLINLIHELLPGPAQPVPVKCDNQGAIATAGRDAATRKLRHMDIRYNFLKDLEEKDVIKVSHTPTASQVADIMTKALAGPRVKSLRENIGLIP